MPHAPVALGRGRAGRRRARPDPVARCGGRPSATDTLATGWHPATATYSLRGIHAAVFITRRDRGGDSRASLRVARSFNARGGALGRAPLRVARPRGGV